MCHMIADTTEELLQMADNIGVKRKWIQYPGTCNEHFDICFSKRQKAVRLGAQEIHFKVYAEMIETRTTKHGIHWTQASITRIRQDHAFDVKPPIFDLVPIGAHSLDSERWFLCVNCGAPVESGVINVIGHFINCKFKSPKKI